MDAQCALAAQREAAERVVVLLSSLSSLSFSLSDSLPWWLSGGSSGWSPAAVNKPRGEINQPGGATISTGATHTHTCLEREGRHE